MAESIVTGSDKVTGRLWAQIRSECRRYSYKRGCIALTASVNQALYHGVVRQFSISTHTHFLQNAATDGADGLRAQ